MGLVQSKQGVLTGTPPGVLTITLDSPVGSGHGLVVMSSSSGATTDGHVTGITLGGSADHFAQAAQAGTSGGADISECWLDLNCAAGQSAVAITTTGSSGAAAVMATVYEFDNLLTASAFDKTAGVATATSPWSSGATATTSQTDEVLVGHVFATGSSAPVITGPAGPWANLAQQAVTIGAFQNATVSGWQAVAATGTATYSGTATNMTDGTVLVVTLKLAAAAALPDLAMAPRIAA